MVNDSLDDFLKSLNPGSYLDYLEKCGKVRKTGAILRNRTGVASPEYEPLQTREEVDRSWQ